MKKLLIFLFFLFIAFFGYIIYNSRIDKGIPVLNIEDIPINIDNIYIYGTHLNLNGSLIDDNNLQLVLYNGEFLEYNININNNNFNLSDMVNEGICLEDIPKGTYYAFLRSKNQDAEGNDVYKYYALNNKSNYDEMTYYTFSDKNNKIVVNTDTQYNTLTFNVTSNKDKNIYDVVVDPGHGGKDSGASKNGYNEADLTMKIAIDLKQKLEKYGFSVKLTRDENQLSKDEKLNDYGTHGRAIIPYEVKAKYVFSIHLNSNYYSSVHGIELYTPANINYTFIKDVAKNISNTASVSYSSSKVNRVFDGVYTRIFTEDDIKNAKKDFLERDMKPYDITTKSNYYFMIRETGGIVTGAYVDNRNSDTDYNPYYKSNVAAESYLLELGYISNKSDLDNIKNKMDKYTGAIADTFNSYFSK